MKWMSLLSLSMLISACIGCSTRTATNTDKNPAQTAQAPTGPLRLLVLDDPGLATMLEREWRARSDGEIEVTNDSASHLLEQFAGGLRKLETDIVIFPSAMLGELAERQIIRQLPADLVQAPEYKQLEVFSLVRRHEMLWDERPFAVSFGSPSLVLLRRTDLVPNAPETWEELSREVEQLTKTLPAGMQPLAQPLADGWAARMLLVRAAAYLFDSKRVSTVFDYRSLEPRIATPPFVRALKELVSDCHGVSTRHTPSSALADFLDGKCAIAITWASALPTGGDEEPVTLPVAISDLPGSKSRYDFRIETWVPINSDSARRVTVTGVSGRLGAVSRSAKNAALAATFLSWASGPEHSAQLSPRSTETTLFRQSQLANPENWVHARLPQQVAAPYAEVVVTSLTRAESITWPRIPGSHRYAEELSQAVREAAANQASVEASLTNVGENWSAISQELGVDDQLRAYRRSLGIDIR